MTERDAGAGREPLGRNYWLLLTSSGVSNLGDGISSAALPLLATLITSDPLAFSGVAVASRLPWLLFALQAGAIADRVDRRRLMVAMQVARFALFGVIGLAALGDWATMPLLYVVSLAVGVCETLYDNAAQAFLPSLVDKDRLERANGRLFSVEWSANQFIGPPLGGLLFAVAVSLPILLNAGTFLVSAALLAVISGRFGPGERARAAQARRAAPAAQGPADVDTTPAIADAPDIAVLTEPVAASSLWAEIREGLRWLWQHRVLRTLGILLGISNGATTMGFATFALYATDEDILGLGETGFGLLLTAGGVGSVIGGLLADRIVDRIGRAAALWGALITFPLCSLVYVFAGHWSVIAITSIVFIFAGTVWNVITVSLRQTIIPDHLLGRVNSVYRFLGWGSMPVGALIGGLIADGFGLRAPWLVGAVLMAVPLPFAARTLTGRAVEAARAAAE